MGRTDSIKSFENTFGSLVRSICFEKTSHIIHLTFGHILYQLDSSNYTEAVQTTIRKSLRDSEQSEKSEVWSPNFGPWFIETYRFGPSISISNIMFDMFDSSLDHIFSLQSSWNKKWIKWYATYNMSHIGRFQTLLRESVKFSNFEKLSWSYDFAWKLTPM